MFGIQAPESKIFVIVDVEGSAEMTHRQILVPVSKIGRMD